MAIKNIKLLDAEDYARIPADKRQDHYSEIVEGLIRKRYTVGAELAILRQRDEKPVEFAEYNAYAEQCKAAAKRILAGK